MARLDTSLIRDLALFASMREEELLTVLDEAVPRQVRKGGTLFEQGDTAEEFFVLLGGRLRVVQVTPEGEQVLIRFVVPGEVCGVAVAMRRPDYPASASAVVDSLALVWRSSQWPALCDRVPALARNTLHVIGERLQEAHSRIREFSTEETERRVAHTVLRLVRQAGRKTERGILVDFPVTREDIAEMTGTTLHTVSRIMSGWEAKGLVEGGRRRILVRQAHELFTLAEAAAEPERTPGSDMGDSRGPA